MTHKIDAALALSLHKELTGLNDYLVNDDSTYPRIGIYNGLSGLCLYLFQRYRANKDEEILKELYRQLDRLINCLEEREKIDWSYSSGMAGCAWMLEFLAGHDIIEQNDNKLFEKIDAVLFNQMQEELCCSLMLPQELVTLFPFFCCYFLQPILA